jgi:hypothetical protein
VPTGDQSLWKYPPFAAEIVDGFLYNCNDEIKRREYISNTINSNFDYIHVHPKPTLWQGKYRVTQDDYFAAGNTRNTGVCYAKYSYVAFHDDLGCPSKTWLSSVLIAKNNNVIQCGAYTKSCDMVVKDGLIISKMDKGIDNRLNIYNKNISLCNGSHFYGSSFCMPLSVYFKINGINEMCDGCGGEDYDFGIRLIRMGYKIYYNKEMFINESEDIFGSDKERKCIRKDPKKDINNPKSDLSHYLLNYCNDGPIVVNQLFSLKEYNYKINYLKQDPNNVFDIPNDTIHFFTNELISKGL